MLFQSVVFVLLLSSYNMLSVIFDKLVDFVTKFWEMMVCWTRNNLLDFRS